MIDSATAALVVALATIAAVVALLVLIPAHFTEILPVAASSLTAVIGFFFGHQVGQATK